MKYRWPFLDHVKAPDSHTFAARCVGELLGKPLLQQLKERRVFGFCRRPLLRQAGLGLYTKRFPIQGFQIYVSSDLGVGSVEECFSFAHELGHTFGYNLKTLARLPGANPHTRKKGQKGGRIHRCLENFCDEFGYLWMSHTQNRRELENFLHEHSASEIVVAFD